MAKKIHIGKTIKEQVFLQNISVIEFAEKINCTPRNAYKIFCKPSIDTDLLVNISNVVGLNFFIHYLSEEEIQELRFNKYKEADLQDTIKSLEYTILHLKTLKKEKPQTNK